MRSIFLAAGRCLSLTTLLALGMSALLSIAAEASLQAQSSSGRTALWAAPVVGVATMGWLGGVDASLYNQRGLFRLRYTNQGGGSRGDDAATAMQEVALMMGDGRLLDLRQNGQRWDGGEWWSAAAGLAVVNATYPKPDPSKTTLGVAAEVQVITRRSPNLSITLLGNLNDKVPFVGVSLGWVFGRKPWSQPQPAQPHRRTGPPLAFSSGT